MPVSQYLLSPPFLLTADASRGGLGAVRAAAAVGAGTAKFAL